MMLDNKTLQARIVDNVYSLSSNHRLIWREHAKDSFRTKAGKLQVDVDKSAAGEQVVYVLWVWDEGGNLAGRIDGRDIVAPSGSNFKNYQEIIRHTFDLAKINVRNSALQRVADALDSLRESNLSENREDEAASEI